MTRHAGTLLLLSLSLPTYAQTASQGSLGGTVSVSAGQVTLRQISPVGKKGTKKSSGKQQEKSGSQASTNRTLALDMIGEDKVKRGYGFDIFTGEILPTVCVSVNQPSTTTPGTLPANVDVSTMIQSVSTLSELRSSSGTSAGATLTYSVFSVGADHSQYRNDYFNSYFKYISFNVEVDRSIDTFEPRQLSQDAVNAAYNNRFKDVCGEMYVVSIAHGASLKGVATAQTNSTGTSTTSETDVSAGIAGLLGAHGSSAASMTKITDNSTLVYDVHAQGVPDQSSKPLDQLIQYAYDFPSQVAGANAPVSYTLARYDRLPVAPPDGVGELPYAAVAALVPLADKRDVAVQQANNLRFARVHPNLYQPDAALDVELQKTTDFLTKIASVVDVCEKQPIGACTSAVGLIGDVPPTTLQRK